MEEDLIRINPCLHSVPTCGFQLVLESFFLYLKDSGHELIKES